jgi:4-oxalocrotonate tautomerase
LLFFLSGYNSLDNIQIALKGVRNMPVVTVRALEGISAEKKEELMDRITVAMKEVLGKNPEATHVIIEEVSAENWGIRGKTVAAIRSGK